MNRTIANVCVDLAASMLFLGMIATGYILHFPLPPGTNRVFALWGLTRHQWGDIHSWISLALLATIAVHLALHWKWVVTVVGKRLRLIATPHPSMFRTGMVVAGVLAIAFGLFAVAVHWGVREMAEPLHALDLTNDNDAGEMNSPSIRTSDSPSRVAFWADVHPIFERRCLSCHGPHRQLAGFRVDQREGFFGESSAPPLIVPGNSAESRLIAIVSGAKSEMQMSDKHRLPEHEVSLLSDWIDAGADWPAAQK